MVGCTSKAKNENTVPDTIKQEVKPLNEKVRTSINIKKPAIIYDTLVFIEHMKGEALLEKFREAKSQLKFYKRFINPKRINSLKIIKESHTKTEIKYLGKMQDVNKLKSYDVITNFTIWGIGEMLSPRGRSEVAFVSNEEIIIYNLSMPYELPNYIEKNVLYFSVENTKIGISISGGLPPMLCIPEIGCY